MAQHAHLDPSPFFLQGGPTGILMIHGYTGAPPEMRPVGEALNAAGLTVSGPRLPGHGATVEEMNRCRWPDWTEHVEQSYGALRERCERVFVAGLSMGSLLTLNFAAHHPKFPARSPILRPPGFRAGCCPGRRSLRYFIKAAPKGSDSDLVDPLAEQHLWCYDVDPVPTAAQLYFLIVRVRRLLPTITCPLLIVYSTGDGAIHPTSAQRTFDLAGSRDKQIIKLEGSGHVITVDAQWQFVAGQTLAWVRQHGG